jgi:hypothetical protein
MFAGATVEDMIFSYQISRKTKIRWLRENGVGHHFHETIRGYLRQQFTFGRDTVIAYWQRPKLLTVKTHQGRLLYIETAVAGLTMLGALISRPLFFAGILAIWLMNMPLIAACFKTGGLPMAFKALMFLPVRDAVWVASLLAGVAKILGTRRQPEKAGWQ